MVAFDEVSATFTTVQALYFGSLDFIIDKISVEVFTESVMDRTFTLAQAFHFTILDFVVDKLGKFVFSESVVYRSEGSPSYFRSKHLFGLRRTPQTCSANSFFLGRS